MGGETKGGRIPGCSPFKASRESLGERRRSIKGGVEELGKVAITRRRRNR